MNNNKSYFCVLFFNFIRWFDFEYFYNKRFNSVYFNLFALESAKNEY